MTPRTVLFAMLLSLGLLGAAQAEPEAPQGDASLSARPCLAIAPFMETYSADGVIVQASDIDRYLTTEFSQTGRFTIVPQGLMLRDLIEPIQIEDGSGMYDMSSTPVGTLRKAEYLFRGSIGSAKLGKASATVRIDYTIHKLRTGDIVWSGSGEGIARAAKRDIDDESVPLFDEAIRLACSQVVADLIDTGAFPIRALVTGIDAEGRVWLDLGVGAGLKEGMTLEIVEWLPQTDTASGTILGYLPCEVLGEIVLETVLFDQSVGHVVSGTCDRGNIAERLDDRPS